MMTKSTAEQVLREALKTGGDGSLDVKEIAEACRAGDPAAKAVFDGLSEALAELLAPILTKLGSDALILGGQISRSADLFMGELTGRLPCQCCHHNRHIDGKNSKMIT